MIDTSNFVELEMQALDMRKTPYTNDKNQLSQDKLLYTSLKSEFSSFTQTFKNLAAFKGNEKKVTLSQDGYINVKADGCCDCRNIYDYTDELHNGIKSQLHSSNNS